MELWLSGPIEGVRPLLMPAAHTFLQVRTDVRELLSGLTHEQIWTRPGQSASIGFHAVHIAGATDRLMTYARGEQMSDAQVAAMKGEATVSGLDAAELIARVDHAIDSAIAQVRATREEELQTFRGVGRKLLPSTTFGLITHAAEHGLRHTGQIATLRKIIG